MNTPREWEEEFDEKWYLHHYMQGANSYVTVGEDVKRFIRAIEDKAREEERERVRRLVEGMKITASSKRDPWSIEVSHVENQGSYNQALSDIIKALNEKV